MKNAPAFERRHYEAVARIMAEGTTCGEPIVVGLVHDFADHFAKDNPRFDRARFLKACGVES